MGDYSPERQELRRYAGALAVASGVFILFMSLVFLIFAGNVTRLACQEQPDRQVDCQLQNTWFGFIVINEQVVEDVRRAEVGEHCDEEGDCAYRLELVSGEVDRIALTPFYSAGRAEKAAAQEQVTAFLKRPGGGDLGMLVPGSSGQGASALLAALAGAGGGGLIVFGMRQRRIKVEITE